VFFGVALGLFYGRGYYFSLSIINREDMLATFFEGRTVDAAIAVAAGALIAGWAARRRGLWTGALAGLSTAYLSASVLLLLSLYYLALWGIRFPYYLPDLREGFRFYLTLLALLPVGCWRRRWWWSAWRGLGSDAWGSESSAAGGAARRRRALHGISHHL